MAICIICHHETLLDDVAVSRDARVCVCLRCHERETGTALPLAKALRKAVTAAMGDRSSDLPERGEKPLEPRVSRRVWRALRRA